MKTIVTIIVILLTLGCDFIAEPPYFSYYKSVSTGLCYAERHSAYQSHTCVPCDSLKNVPVEIVP